MRFLFISRRGASLSIAQRIASEGHIVKFFVNNKLYRLLGTGIVDKAEKGEFHNCDLVIFDESGIGEYADVMAKNKPIYGSSKLADLFNKDIDYKQKILKRADLTLDNANGVEINVCGWYNGFDFIRPLHSFFKKTKLMENDLSIDTESMGCLLWYHKTNKLAKQTILKFKDELKKTGYRGAVNFKVSVKENSIAINDVFLGFTYDNTYAAFEGIRQPLGEFIYKSAFGSSKQIKASPDWLVATRVTVPPYPMKMTDEMSKPVLIEGINEQNLKHIWLRDIYMQGSKYYSAMCDGFLMTITARGLNPTHAIERTHRTIKNLSIPNIQYRKDIVEGMDNKYKLVKKWGWV